MGNLLKSWVFFTALMLFLMTAATIVPELAERFFGDTEEKVTAMVADVEQEAQAVWAELTP